jgi:hypothetical protein
MHIAPAAKHSALAICGMMRSERTARPVADHFHSQLKATAVIIGSEDFAARLERAVERSKPKLIEAQRR